jgi:predicted nucleotidyltransferase
VDKNNGKRMNIDEITVPVCAINDLIDLKMKTARPKDLDDIEHLREIQRIREKSL